MESEDNTQRQVNLFGNEFRQKWLSLKETNYEGLSAKVLTNLLMEKNDHDIAIYYNNLPHKFVIDILEETIQEILNFDNSQKPLERTYGGIFFQKIREKAPLAYPENYENIKRIKANGRKHSSKSKLKSQRKKLRKRMKRLEEDSDNNNIDNLADLFSKI